MKIWSDHLGYWSDSKSLWQKWTSLPFKKTDEHGYHNFSKILIFRDIYVETRVSCLVFFVYFSRFFVECGIGNVIWANTFCTNEENSSARSFWWSGSSNRFTELGERVSNVFSMKGTFKSEVLNLPNSRFEGCLHEKHVWNSFSELREAI